MARDNRDRQVVWSNYNGVNIEEMQRRCVGGAGSFSKILAKWRE